MNTKINKNLIRSMWNEALITWRKKGPRTFNDPMKVTTQSTGREREKINTQFG